MFKIPGLKNIKKVGPVSEPKTVQEWLPIDDIYNNVIHRNDGSLVSGLRVMPLNIELKSRLEKKRIISGVHEAYNGQINHTQIFSIGRPVDLDAYIQGLEEIYRNAADVHRKKLMRDYLKYVSGIASSGEALEPRYYILSGQEQDRDSLDELIKRSYELAGNMGKAGLEVVLCDDREAIDMMFTFTNPVQSAYEKAPDHSGPSLPPQVDW